MAIDREGMNKALGFGVGAPHYYLDWAVGSLGYDESIVKNEYNPAKAKELLARGGLPQRGAHRAEGDRAGAREHDRRVRAADVVAGRHPDQAREHGAASLDRRGAGKEVPGLLLARDVHHSRRPGHDVGTHPGRRDRELVPVRRPGIDSRMDKGVQELDPKKRHEIYKGVLTRLQEQAYLATGIAMPLLMARRKEVMGVTYNYQMPNLDRVWLNK